MKFLGNYKKNKKNKFFFLKSLCKFAHVKKTHINIIFVDYVATIDIFYKICAVDLLNLK